MRKIIILSIATAALMLSCSVKPYKSPDMSSKLDSLSNLLNASSEPSENIQAFPWRKIYTDPYLQGYIEQALANNHDLLKAQLSVEQAYAYLRSARAALSPSLNSVSVGAGTIAQTDELMQGAVPATAKASWEIDIWGKLNAAKKAEKAKIQYAINNMQAIQTSVISGVATAYFELIAYDMQRDIILKTIDNRQQYLDTVIIMKKYGRVNEVAVQQAAATLADVQSQLPQVDLAIVQTENALAVLLSKPCPTKFERSKKIDLSNLKLYDKLPYGLLRNRPDVRAAEQNFRNAFELWNVSRASMYPSLTISAEGGIASLVHAHVLVLDAIASLTQPIWNGRKLRTEMEVKNLEKQKAEISFEQTVLKAGAEVSNAHTSLYKYKEIADKQVIKLEAYVKAYDYSYELFINGYANYLDVLVAQDGVFSSEISLVDAYLKTVTSQIELYRALGGGADSEMVDKQAIELAKIMTNQTKSENKRK